MTNEGIARLQLSQHLGSLIDAFAIAAAEEDLSREERRLLAAAVRRILVQLSQHLGSLVGALAIAAAEEGLSPEVRLLLAAAVRSRVVSRQKPGKKPHDSLDRACADYRSGLRGLSLYKKHISNFKKLSRWRRTVEQNRLLKNISKRQEREKKSTSVGTDN